MRTRPTTCSNFVDNQVDDLRPGHWLTFSHSQLADLNNQAPPGTSQFQAQGNVYNALLYHGNTNSEITTLVTGSGNDTLIGNDLDNVLNAGAGSDTIIAGTGDDIMIGGPDADAIYFHFGNGILSSGHDILRDTPLDLSGDQVRGFGSGYTSALDVLGVQFGQIGLTIADNHQSTTLRYRKFDRDALRHVHKRRVHDRYPRQRRSGTHDLQLRAVHAHPGGRQGCQFRRAQRRRRSAFPHR